MKEENDEWFKVNYIFAIISFTQVQKTRVSYAVALLFFFFLIETFFFDGNLKKDIRATESKTDRFTFDILTL